MNDEEVTPKLTYDELEDEYAEYHSRAEELIDSMHLVVAYNNCKCADPDGLKCPRCAVADALLRFIKRELGEAVEVAR